jgi:Zn-dependent protease
MLFFATNGRFLFAYAKPVPYNPYNLKNPRWGSALVGAAGPLANLLLALVFAFLIRIFPTSPFAVFFDIIVYANILLMVFNLVPIPPLDGSKVLFAILPDSFRNLKMTLERYGWIILLFFIIFLFELISPIINFLHQLLIGQAAFI